MASWAEINARWKKEWETVLWPATKADLKKAYQRSQARRNPQPKEGKALG